MNEVQVAHMGILTEEGLGFKHETFHVPNLVHIIFTGKHSRPLLFVHLQKRIEFDELGSMSESTVKLTSSGSTQN